MSAAHVAYLCTLLSIAVVHCSWLWAASSGHLQWCNPYWSHCFSISATANQYPQAWLFKGGMAMVAILMLAYWGLLRHWLRRLRCHPGLSGLIVMLGMTSSLALCVYAFTLGNGSYALVHHVGIVIFLTFNVFAHLLLINALSERVRYRVNMAPGLINLTLLCLIVVVIGLIGGITGYFWSGYQDWQNAFKWWFSLLLMGQYTLVGRIWVHTNFKIMLSLDRDDSAKY